MSTKPIELTNDEIRASAINSYVVRRKSKNKALKHFERGNTYGQGRPVLAKSMTQLIRETAAELKDGSRTRAKALVDALFERAENGDIQAANTILNRLEGKPAETVTIAGNVEYTHTEQQEIELIHKLELTHPEILHELVEQTVASICQSDISQDEQAPEIEPEPAPEPPAHESNIPPPASPPPIPAAGIPEQPL